MTRRDAARKLSLFLAGSPLLPAQDAPWIPSRMPAIEELNNVMEFEPLARTKMLKTAYDYIAGGVDDEWTLRRNRQGFEGITLRPRMLVDVSKLDLSLDLFGSRIEMPILIAPTGGHQQAHPEGELATVKGAGAAKTIMVVSSNSSYPIDRIGGAASGPFWVSALRGSRQGGHAGEGGAGTVCRRKGDLLDRGWAVSVASRTIVEGPRGVEWTSGTGGGRRAQSDGPAGAVSTGIAISRSDHLAVSEGAPVVRQGSRAD